MLLFDTDLRYTGAHGEVVARRGHGAGALIGRRVDEVLEPETWAELAPFYRRALAGEALVHDHRSHDAATRYELRFEPVRGDGTVVGGMVVVRDVTAERREESIRAASLECFEAMADTALEGHCRYAPGGTLLWASSGMERVVGWPPGELVGGRMDELVHPQDAPRRDEAVAAVARTREPRTVELRVRHANGGWRWLESSIRGVFGEAGDLVELHTTSRDVTERRRADELRTQWELTFANTTRGITLTDPATGTFTAVNPAFAHMHGGEPADFVGRPLASVFAAESRARIPEFAEIMGRDGYLRYEAEHLRRDGSTFPVETEVLAARDDEGDVLYRLAYYTDRTEHRDRARSERAAQERFERAFADAPIGMALVGLDGTWLRVNSALLEMLRYEEEDLLTKTFQDITHPDDLDADVQHAERLLDGEIRSYTMEKRYFTANGHMIWALLSGSLVRDDAGRPLHFIAQIVDISERKRMEERLHRLADHDPLTGLWNRRRFDEELARQLARSRRYGEPAALLMFDLDGFKYVNDTLGHGAGDDLIVHVAATVAGRLRRTDSLARLGGDEFAVLLPGTGAGGARELAQEICDLVASTPLTIAGEPVHTTLSGGVAMLDPDAEDGGDMMVAADVALYEAKEAGRNRVVPYEDGGGQRERLTSTLVWSQRLRQSLDADGFVLHAQPVVDLHSGEVAFHELLVRMTGPAGELVYPGTFLYCAERFGYIRQLDRWVVAAATRLAARHPGRPLAVNLSGRSVVDPALGDVIEGEIAAAGCDPRALLFEVTETEAIANMQHAQDLARRLRRLGARFALDDFGSGFAGFHHLKALPVDLVKLDGEFVRDLDRDGTDRLIVSAVQGVAAGVGADLVAEHVEDGRAVARLLALGVRYGQGFHLGVPGPADEVLAAGAPVPA